MHKAFTWIHILQQISRTWFYHIHDPLALSMRRRATLPEQTSQILPVYFTSHPQNPTHPLVLMELCTVQACHSKSIKLCQNTYISTCSLTPHSATSAAYFVNYPFCTLWMYSDEEGMLGSPVLLDMRWDLQRSPKPYWNHMWQHSGPSRTRSSQVILSQIIYFHTCGQDLHLVQSDSWLPTKRYFHLFHLSNVVASLLY